MGVRHYLRNERRMLASIGLALRGRKALAPGAEGFGYSRSQRPLLVVFAVLTVAEGLLFALVGFGLVVHLVLAAVELYSLLLLLGLLSSMTVHPHSVSPDEVHVRYGAFLDVRVPVSAIAAVRARREDHSGKPALALADGTFTVALSWQTNVVLELRHPVAFTRPLGRTGEARVLKFYADDPRAATAAIEHAMARPRDRSS
ncbi:hypothetical protein GCM10017786_26880 [Amycolatopsis deserti]|uniref:Integral membrane protein n=1 Tax=Amycolatopsis deserti TaxID=185696 RepID=A0ABQ3IY34_9PSEU|nr:hypothetical protein [Amycolatopsis deserti]GHE92815.1 hypothetical protein GCM10017786_26880 [Amycolatopsis deserti]